MNKGLQNHDAIVRLKQSHGAALAGADIHFANLNGAKDVWWLDIPLGKLDRAEYIDLALYDYRFDKLHQLRVPTRWFRDNLRDLVVRKDKDVISLELSAQRANRFRDVRPGGRGVLFDQFLQAPTSGGSA